MVFSFLIFCVLCLYLISFFGLKAKWLQVNQQKNSMLNLKANASVEDYLEQLGAGLARYFPQEFINHEEYLYQFLQKDKKSFYVNLAKAFMVLSLMPIIFIFSRNIFFLLMFVFVFLYFVFDARLSYRKALDDLDSSVSQLVRCLDVLLVKSETPIVSALELIASGLNQEHGFAKQELKKIIQQASKSGINLALKDYNKNNYGPRLKEFFSLLISVNEGASKKAISEQINNFLEMQNQSEQERLKAQAENLQLYLILPVIFMLLVIMFPMADAIMYSLQNTGFTKGLILNTN